MSWKPSALYPILDTRLFPEEPSQRRNWITISMQALADAGVSIVQLRAKGMPREAVLRDASMLLSSAPSTMRLILNDYVALVREAGFHGVHLGQGDQDIEEARAMLGDESIIGLSTHSPEQIVAGDKTSASYLAIGPVFATASKENHEPVVGLDGVRKARALTTKPLVAIGGITLQQAPSVQASGADSIAVIGALFQDGATGVGKLAGDFLRIFQ